MSVQTSGQLQAESHSVRCHRQRVCENELQHEGIARNHAQCVGSGKVSAQVQRIGFQGICADDEGQSLCPVGVIVCGGCDEIPSVAVQLIPDPGHFPIVAGGSHESCQCVRHFLAGGRGSDCQRRLGHVGEIDLQRQIRCHHKLHGGIVGDATANPVG